MTNPQELLEDASPYLADNYGPVPTELTAFDLPVSGEIPSELEGRLLRNGPNPIDSPDLSKHHWFLGDGMVHGIRLRGSKAEWYRNRWVGSERTQQLLNKSTEKPVTAAIGPNTNVIGHAGRTYALVEAGTKPVELTYELETVRTNGFEDSLLHGYTAHPKYDPLTGDMHAMAYAPQTIGANVEYIVIGPDGSMTKTLSIPMPTMPMVHDMGLTQTYAILFDLPVALDIDLAVAGSTFPFRWNDDYNSRVGLLPRDATSADEMIWCEIEPCYAFHPLNSYDEVDGTVIIDICRFDRIFDLDRNGPFRDSLPQLERWTVDASTRRVKREVIDERFQEFPRVAGSVLNTKHRYGYTASVGSEADGWNFGPTIKHDLDNGTSEAFDYGAGRGGGEPVFVSRSDGATEDDGWLLTVVHDAGRQSSDLVIVDAQDFSRPEVARIELPARVPHGFHGNWVRDNVVSPTD